MPPGLLLESDPFLLHRLPSLPPTPSLEDSTEKRDLLPLLTKAKIVQKTIGSDLAARAYKDSTGRGRCSICKEKIFTSYKSAREHVGRAHAWLHKCNLCQATFPLRHQKNGLYTSVNHVMTTHREDPRVQSALQPTMKRISQKRSLFVQAGILRETPPLSEAGKVISLPNGEFTCSLCRKSQTRQKDKVLHHILTKHRGVLMFCDICQQMVGFRYGTQHVKNQHPTHRRVLEALGRIPEDHRRTTDTRKDVKPQATEQSPPSMSEDVPDLLFQSRILQRVSSLLADTKEVCSVCNCSFPLNTGATHVWESHREEEVVRNALLLSCGRKWKARPSKNHYYFSIELLKTTSPLTTKARMVQKKTGEFTCSECCGKPYLDRGQARRHIVEAHQRVRALCTLCSKTFLRRSAIAHVGRKHKTHPEVAAYLRRTVT